MSRTKKLKRTGLLLLGTLVYITLYSQENYIPGYIIKQNKDTVNGFVDYRNWDKNPDLIRFKSDIASTPISFNPIDIVEFGVQDEIYVGGIVDTEVTQLKVDELTYDYKVKIEVDTVFLQTLFRGEKELYYHKNSDGRENFYIKNATEYELLIYKKYLKQQGGNDLVVEYEKYLGQLTLYLNNCSTISAKLKKTSYNQNSLYRLFQYHNECSPSDITFQKKSQKISAEFGVLAGTSITTLTFSSEHFEELTERDFDPSINLSVGLFLDLVLPRNQGKWSINNELLFTSYNVNDKYEDFIKENWYYNTTMKLGFSYLKINNLLRFKFPIGSVFVYVNGGMSNGFAIRETNYRKVESKVYSREEVKEELALEDTRKYEQGFILGTGIKYKDFSFEVRAEKGNGISTYTLLSSTAKRYYFLLGYRF